MKLDALNSVVKYIKKGKVFLITSHVNLEGDALGSELSLAYILEKMGKKFFIYNASVLPAAYRFLPLIHYLDKRKNKKFDTAIVLDCSDLERIGKVKKFINSKKIIINIDHHPDNIYFGKVNWVDPTASAVGELIYGLFRKLAISLNKDAAICLYAAIITDTGGFRNQNTTVKTHRIVSRLLEYDFDASLVFENIYGMYSLARMKLLGLSLRNIKVNKEKGIVWMSVSQKMLRDTGADLKDTEGFIEMLRSIKGIKLAILFQEVEKNRVKIGFRSRRDLDVGKLARLFGGGGHFAASGCMLEGRLKDIENMVLHRIIKEV
ncbi:MAG: bifunctional oligoribonuclease/PAP phosphatase NrnA [Candidatus Omnitrophica bacterium]|nr:bifunctional oligoribonuclease/PAP phosphatase NrnA [Candidatus Omnitrophota bacterium]